jgi:phosphoribosylformimino-5-aminoimidazole carboxamide ribotide isomerase
VYGPWEKIGQRFWEAGLHRWHVVDLEGAKAGHLVQKERLSALRKAFPEVRTSLGGGIRSEADLQWALGEGFDWVVIGSMAVLEPAAVRAWILTYGPSHFILAADARDGKVALKGWQEEALIEAQVLIRAWAPLGVAAFLSTQVERDGLLTGVDVPFYGRLVGFSPGIPIIASGGIRGPEDLEALRQVGVSAAVVGRALYEQETFPLWIRSYTE